MRRSLRSWLWRVPLDQEIDEELAFHVEMRTRELIAKGMDPNAAREAALSRMGDATRLKRTCVDIGRKRDREMRLTQWIHEMRDDVRFALRQLKASPAFTAVAVLTLALGLGANSAIFALADAAFLRPLPFDHAPDRLVMVWERTPFSSQMVVTPLDFRDAAEQNRTFAAMAALTGGAATMLGSDGLLEEIPAQTVTTSFFDVLGVRPLAGRTFVAADAPNTLGVMVLSEGFWRRRFGADPTLVGREIVVDQIPRTVIGIVPERFRFIPPPTAGGTAAATPALWLLFDTLRGNAPWMRTSHFMTAIGRLKPGVSMDAAQEDLDAIAARNEQLFPDSNKGHGFVLEPLRDALIGREIRLTSLLLLGVVGFVLLMCCVNITNLMMARTTGRERELAVRSALGASRRRVIAHLVTESLVLASLGGAAGLALGAAVLRAAPSMIPAGLLPRVVPITFDGRVVIFCAAATIVVGICFGLAPALQSTGRSLVQAIGSASRASGRGRFRTTLAVTEVAAAVIVLCGAGLLLRTLLTIQRDDAGYRARDVLTTVVAVPMPVVNKTRYPTPESVRQFYAAVEREIEQLPGVQQAAWGSVMPLDGGWFGQAFSIEGDPPKPMAQRDMTSYHLVSPDYFETLDIPIVKGRAFTDADTTDGLPVCIVSEAFAERYLAGRDPIGARVLLAPMSFGPAQERAWEIVGIAHQVKAAANETQPRPQMYVPLAQNTWWNASLVVRPHGVAAESLASDVRAALARVDRDRVASRLRTIETIEAEAMSRPRFRAALVGAFAGLALILAIVGVFGILAYAVEQRTREFGVRIALGASATDVLRLVFSSAARLTAAGAAIGLGAAAVLSRWIAALLFGVSPLDPLTFAAVAALLGATGIIAAAAPAWRAARVDPAVTLRGD